MANFCCHVLFPLSYKSEITTTELYSQPQGTMGNRDKQDRMLLIVQLWLLQLNGDT